MVEPETDPARFWRFALAVYMPEEARTVFLRLQDEAGADVPMALFCLWRGAEGTRISERAMAGAIAFSTAWRAARVEPLRALRRGWKDAPDADLPPTLSEAARQHVARVEQAVERLQMEHLAGLEVGGERGGSAAGEATRNNLALYCRLAGLSPDPVALDTLARMAEAQASSIA